MERLTVRPASAADVPAILTLIRGIAEYERLSHEVEASEALLRQHGFGPRPVFEALLAERIPEGIQEGSDVAPRPEAVATDPAGRSRRDQMIKGSDVAPRPEAGSTDPAGRSRRDQLLEGSGHRAVGFALYFFTFSTFKARPTLYLEDLFVLPGERRHGVGRRLFAELAKIAVARECGRMEWSVLDWNTPARDFYFKIGAVPMNEWTVFRLTPEAFGRLACEAVDPPNA